MFHNEKSTSVVPSDGTATTKSVASTLRLDKPVTMQEVQDACKMWNLPMILSLKEAAEVIKIQPMGYGFGVTAFEPIHYLMDFTNGRLFVSLA